MQNDKEQQQKPIFFIKHPFRCIEPYYHCYKTFTKGRWLNQPLLTTLIKQFKAYNAQYYQKCIASGKIRINNKMVTNDYILQNGDQIIHESIRIQPPVLNLPIDIIQEDDSFLIINKPPSLSVHTGGGHHYNTVQNLLKYLYGYHHLYVLHRLDKLTSGLLILAKDKHKIQIFHNQSQKQIMKKMYFARVNGEVQWQQKDFSAIIECISHKDGVYQVTAEINLEQQNQKKINQQKQQQQQKEKVNINFQQIDLQNINNKKQDDKRENQEQQNIKQPQKIVQKIKNSKKIKKLQKIQKYEQKDTKTSRTLFKKIWYDKQTNSSLLECYPITGRTHQIRVHLQYLGYPILNDTVYGGRFVGNRIIQKIIKPMQGSQMSLEQKNIEINEYQWDINQRAWQIMLHSYRYTLSDKTYTSQLPYWYYKQGVKPFIPQKKSQ